MSQTSTLKGQCIAEFLGTGLLIFRCGLRCSTKSRWCVFWSVGNQCHLGTGVAMAIYLTAGVSGAHLNPAVTIALWLFACFDKRKVIPFIVSQVAGAFCAAALVYGLYYNLFFDFEQTHHIVRGSVESVDLAGTFSTYPNPHINFVQAFAVEMVITAILMGLIGVNGRWQRCTTRPFGSLADWSTDCGHWRIYGPIDGLCHEPSA